MKTNHWSEQEAVVLERGVNEYVIVAIRRSLFEQSLNKIRKITGRQYDLNLQRWMVPCTDDALMKFSQLFQGIPVKI